MANLRSTKKRVKTDLNKKIIKKLLRRRFLINYRFLKIQIQNFDKQKNKDINNLKISFSYVDKFFDEAIKNNLFSFNFLNSKRSYIYRLLNSLLDFRYSGIL